MTNTLIFHPSLHKLCREQPLAVLATVANTGPYTNLVAVAFGDDLRSLYFATPRATRKYRNLTADSRVSLLVDNRSNEVTDFQRAAAATIIGVAMETTEAERTDGAWLYLARHPHLKDFLAAPDCALFRVDIERILLVTDFQQVVEYTVAE